MLAEGFGRLDAYKSKGDTSSVMEHPPPPESDALIGRQPVAASADPSYLKWLGWLQIIHDDLTHVALTRDVWSTINGIVGAHPAMPRSHLFAVLARSYASSQAVAVRKQGDSDRGVVTMGRLLTEIAKHPELVTRERFVTLFPPEMRNRGDAQFNRWATPDADHIDGARVNQALHKLKTAIAPVKAYVDKRVAHLDANHLSTSIPTFDQLDTAIDLLFDVFHNYNLLLTAIDIHSLVPVPQYDWLAPFRIPWIPSNG